MGTIGTIVLLSGLVFCFVLSAKTTKTPSFPQSRIVNTTYGAIQGRRLIYKGDKKVDAFQGIPYAQPPVGDLRFKKPVAPEPWSGVKETKEYGPRPIQTDREGAIEAVLPQNEDCLTLNVFTPVWKPKKNSNGFPVIVFIHGGAFVQGSASQYNDINIAKYLVKKDVVVVTIEYRVGFLGFWSSGDEQCPGNNALWDATFALQWVNENIAKFNGDPENISLMGESAGGVITDMLSISPHSRDLFHKVITMSGTATMIWATVPRTPEYSKVKSVRMGVSLNNDIEQWLDDLRTLSARNFSVFVDLVNNTGDPLPGPIFDGVFFPKPIPQLVREAPSKPRIIGLTHFEGLMFSDNQTPLSAVNDTAAMFFPEASFPSDYQDLSAEYSNRLYNASSPNFNEKVPIVETIGDRYMGIGTQLSVMEYTRNSSEDVYLYRFDQFNPNMYGYVGAPFAFIDSTHAADIIYLMGSQIFVPFNFTKKDVEVIEEISTLFTNFAKHGDPNGKKLVNWKPVGNNVQRHLRIGAKSKMSNDFFEGRLLWSLNTRTQANLTGYFDNL